MQICEKKMNKYKRMVFVVAVDLRKTANSLIKCVYFDTRLHFQIMQAEAQGEHFFPHKNIKTQHNPSLKNLRVLNCWDLPGSVKNKLFLILLKVKLVPLTPLLREIIC